MLPIGHKVGPLPPAVGLEGTQGMVPDDTVAGGLGPSWFLGRAVAPCSPPALARKAVRGFAAGVPTRCLQDAGCLHALKA